MWFDLLPPLVSKFTVVLQAFKKKNLNVNVVLLNVAACAKSVAFYIRWKLKGSHF